MAYISSMAGEGANSYRLSREGVIAMTMTMKKVEIGVLENVDIFASEIGMTYGIIG